jgi:transposase
MELLALRAAKLGNKEICAVDSTTRSAFGNSLADTRWGKNKENIKLQQTTEVVVYSLPSHEPVYYKTFPGNMPDCRTLDTIIRYLRTAGFQDLILVTDRGYETGNNLKNMIKLKQPFITCAKTGQAQIYKLISEIPKFETRPETMTIYPERGLYYSQHDMDYEIFEDGELTKVDGLKINLFLNPHTRCSQHFAMDTAIATQKASLEQLILNKTNRCDIDRKDFDYYS